MYVVCLTIDSSRLLYTAWQKAETEEAHTRDNIT